MLNPLGGIPSGSNVMLTVLLSDVPYVATYVSTTLGTPNVAFVPIYISGVFNPLITSSSLLIFQISGTLDRLSLESTSHKIGGQTTVLSTVSFTGRIIFQLSQSADFFIASNS